MRQRTNVFDVPGDYAPPPAPMPEMSQSDITQAEPPSPYEYLSPFHVSLANTAAEQATKTSSLNNVMMRAWEGISPREQEAMRDKERVTARTEALLQSTKALPTDKFEALMAKLEGLGSQLGTMQAPKRESGGVDPISAAATAGAMFLDPANAGRYAGAYTQNRKAEDERAYKEQSEEFKQSQDNLKFQYEATQDQLTLQEKQDDNLRKEAADAINRQLAVLELEGKSADDRLKAAESIRLKAEQAWASANTVGGKQRAAAVLEALGVPVPKDVLDAEVGRMTAQASQQARNAWGQMLNRLRDDFGEIPEAEVANLEAQRAEQAKMYGVPESVFEPIATRKTIQAQKFEENKRQFNERFAWMQEKDRASLAMAQTRIQQAWERLQLMKLAFQNKKMDMYYRMQRGMFSDQMDVLKFGQDAAGILGGKVKTSDLSAEGQAAHSALKEIERKIALQRSKMTGNKDPATASVMAGELAALNAQAAELRAMYEEAVQVAREIAEAAGQTMQGLPEVPVPGTIPSGMEMPTNTDSPNQGGGAKPFAFGPIGGGGRTSQGKRNVLAPPASKATPKKKTLPSGGSATFTPDKK